MFVYFLVLVSFCFCYVQPPLLCSSSSFVCAFYSLFELIQKTFLYRFFNSISSFFCFCFVLCLRSNPRRHIPRYLLGSAPLWGVFVYRHFSPCCASLRFKYFKSICLSKGPRVPGGPRTLSTPEGPLNRYQTQSRRDGTRSCQ